LVQFPNCKPYHMPYFTKKPLLLLAILLLPSLQIFAQSTCPPNIDFEFGNFTNWVCKTGLVSVVNGQNNINFTATGQVAGRHEIIADTDTSKDLYGKFPVVCPNASAFSVKLGNNSSGDECEGIFYTYNIPATATNFAILYNYAVVLQNPGHNPEEQPRFRARVINVTDGDTISCVSFDFTSGANLPGFKVSAAYPDVLYKDWTPVSLDLSGYAGKTIKLEFITSDCTLGAHFGYAYVDVNSSCDGSVIGSTVCVGDTTVTLTAPYGFQSYQWFQDNTFTTTIGTGQSLTFSPAPNVGTVYPVIVTPYPGFGCVDTVYARIATDPKPPSIAGPDITSCRWATNQLGTTPDPLRSYLWTPQNLVSNSHLANPTGFLNTFSPTQFIVKTTTKSSGCFSYDTMILSPKIIDTTLLVSGKINYCIGDTYNTVFKVVDQSTAIQWLFNNTPIAGATNHSYAALQPGSYRAKFVQIGCRDTTRAVVLSDHPYPLAAYTIMPKDSQCVTNNVFTFSNGSSITGTDSLLYYWTFGDGTASINKSAVKSYLQTGRFPVDLYVTSDKGCADTFSSFVNTFPNVAVGFKWDTPCTNAPINLKNLTEENGSLLVNYLWDFGNGNNSTVKDPVPFNYPAAGIYNVKLSASSLGCESAPQSVQHAIEVFEPLPGTRYRDVTIPFNYTSKIYARGGVGLVYNWKPSTQLSSTNTYSPYFYAANDMQYLVDITDRHKCITTDSLNVFVLKKKGLYMPNAFTPNKDGHNDDIQPWLVDMKSLRRFSVFNRFGNLLFSTERDGQGWDGTYKGMAMQSGSYVWIVEYVDVDGTVKMEKGSLLLVR